MEFAFVWKSALLIVVGILLLRLAGRKSISQMSIAQTVIMISIGSIIIQPIIEHSVWKTIGASAIFIGFLLTLEYLQVKFNAVEKFLSGKAKVVIRDGELLPETMKKLRFTVDQLELRLRQQGISNIADVKTATLEINGQLGYELKPYAKPATISDLQQMLAPLYQQLGMQPPWQQAGQNQSGQQGQGQSGQSGQQSDIFQEVRQGYHQTPNPKELH